MQAKKYNANTKHPKIEVKGKYPNIWVDTFPDGHQTIRSLQPGHESFFSVEPAGNYTGHGPDGQKVSVTMDKEHEYGADGKSSTLDGHSDSKVAGTSRTNVDKSSSSETGGNKYEGSGGLHISGSRNSKMDASTGGDHYQTTAGNITTDHDGDKHQNVTGDVVEQIHGNKVSIVGGDTAINNQGGSVDYKLDKGKFRLKAANEIVIDSDTKITFRVGGNSIVMDSSGVTATVNGWKFIKA